MKTKLCSVPTCGNLIGDNSRSGLCSRCNSSRYYWDSRKRYATTRVDTLQFLETRMQFFIKLWAKK